MRRFRLPTRVQAFLSVFEWTTACRNAEHKSDRRHWSVRGNVKVFARLAFTVSGVTVIGRRPDRQARRYAKRPRPLSSPIPAWRT